MITVLVVDDSTVVRELLVHILKGDPELDVVATAKSGHEAVDTAARLRPNVITMDIHMPGMDGYAATRQIMESAPTPIIIVSGSTSVDEATHSFKALEAGAITIMERPVAIGHPDYEAGAARLRDTVRAMSEVPVVRRWKRLRENAAMAPRPETARANGRYEVVAIGSSTGGPVALKSILSGLERPFALPIVIVQHMAAGFMPVFAKWLSESTGFDVRVARDGETLQKNTAYVAPESRCTVVDSARVLRMVNGNHQGGLTPCVEHLFETVCRVYGSRAVAVLLSGMGKDGARGLLEIQTAGGLTVAQDEASSVVFGMPGEAVKLGAANFVLPPDRIAAALNEIGRSSVVL